MIKAVRDFYYNVKNLDQAIQFYKKAFGMTVLHTNEHWTTMQLNGMNIGLHWSEGEDIPKTPRDGHGQSCGGTLTLESDDITADKKQIEKCGGKILGEANEQWGHMLVIEDPDGNVLKLMKSK